MAQRLADKHGRKYIRPKETDLLALLEAGELDYMFIYRSVAKQHQLRILRLPAPINLGSPTETATYHHATVKVTGRKPGEFITHRGAPITYSVTIPKNAPNPRAAEAFLALLLGAEGRAIMRRNGQEPFEPALVDSFAGIPPSLKPLCKKLDGK